MDHKDLDVWKTGMELAEIETQYLIALKLKFIEKDIRVVEMLAEEKRLLLGFRNHVKKHLATNF